MSKLTAEHLIEDYSAEERAMLERVEEILPTLAARSGDMDQNSYLSPENVQTLERSRPARPSGPQGTRRLGRGLEGLGRGLLRHRHGLPLHRLGLLFPSHLRLPGQPVPKGLGRRPVQRRGSAKGAGVRRKSPLQHGPGPAMAGQLRQRVREVRGGGHHHHHQGQQGGWRLGTERRQVLRLRHRHRPPLLGRRQLGRHR